MDENKSNAGNSEKTKEKKEKEESKNNIPSMHKLKRSPPQIRRGSVGATPSDGYKEWFENLLKPIRDEKAKTHLTEGLPNIDPTDGERKRTRQEESPLGSEEKRYKKDENDVPNDLLVKENASLKARLIEMERRLEELEKERTRRDRLETLNLSEELGQRDYNTWKQIADRTWDNKLFTNVEIKIGSPLETDSNVVKVVIVEPDDLQMDKSIQQMFKARFPELKDLEDPFDLLQVTTRTKRLTTTQEVIKITWDGIEEHLWEQLVALRQETGNKKEIATHHVRPIKTDRMRKMVQAIFQKGAKVTIFTTKSRETAEKENIMVREVKKVNKEQKSYAIVVSKTEGDTKDTISKIKKGIEGMASNRAIQQIKTGKEGKIIISLDKDEQAMNTLSKVIEKTIGQGSVKLQGKKENQEIFYIRGLDQSATVEEVMEALEERVGHMGKGEISLSPLRPYGRGNQTVTVYISEKHVGNLTTANEIRIGLVRCRLEKHIELARCYKCWAFDHNTAQCNGEDRRANCYRCGQSGHTAKNCQNVENCLVCKESGHSASSGRCKVYRAAINSVRRQHQVLNQIINGQ